MEGPAYRYQGVRQGCTRGGADFRPVLSQGSSNKNLKINSEKIYCFFYFVAL